MIFSKCFFLFVPFCRGLEFWELRFRSRSFLYRQVLFVLGSAHALPPRIQVLLSL